ncbi:MAG: hypothetical protein AB1428_12240 [Bacteroidota bacterium]
MGTTDFPTRDKEAKRLEVILNKIIGLLPDLQQFYGVRGGRPGLIEQDEGGLFGERREGMPTREEEAAEPPSTEKSVIEQALDQAERGDRALEPGDEIAAVRRIRMSKSGPALRHAHAPGRSDIRWMEGDTVMINTAHPTYLKASEKKVLEYHNLVAAAMAMLREVPTAGEKIELLERFMAEWGKL